MYMKQPGFFFPSTLRTTKNSTVKRRIHTCTVSGTVEGWVEILFTKMFQKTSKGATGCGILCLLQGGYLMHIHAHTCNLATNAWGHHVPSPKQTDPY